MDIGTYTCPEAGCGKVIEGEKVVDPTLGPRIEAHKLGHMVTGALDRTLWNHVCTALGLPITANLGQIERRIISLTTIRDLMVEYVAELDNPGVDYNMRHIYRDRMRTAVK